jgi:hypothetical protein
MAELRIPIIGEFKGKKAFDQAGKSTSALEKGVKRLGAQIVAVFSIQKITQFGKAAAKAFIEDEKAAIRLSQAVKNLGLAFETPNIELFITQMASASGIADDQLRPAMQRLLQTTGSLTKSTSLLTQALDISRGSGVNFETVVNDLSMAYVGQTRGLRKYSLGVTQAELKTMSFAEVQERLTKNFTGANAAYLETYAGKMGILGNAAGEASEIIGEGLIESLMILSGDTTVEDLAETMQELATNTAEALNNLSKFGKGIQDTVGPLATVFEKFINATQPIFNSIVFGDALTWAKQPAERPRMGGYPSSALGGAFVDPNAKARKKSEADAVKRAKELAAMQKKTLDTQKKQNALTKASKVLDLDRISVTAALRGQISETDRLSLQLQLALLDKNESQALKLSAELTEAVKRQNDLKAALLATPEAPNPYRNWKPPTFVGPVMPPSVTAPITEPKFPYGEQVPNFNVPEYMKQGSAGITGRPAGDYLGLSAIGAGATADTILNVVVNVDGDPVANAITSAQVNQSLSGTFSDVSRYNGRGSVSIK